MIKINDVIAFYYNSIGGNYDDTFGNTVTLESGIDVTLRTVTFRTVILRTVTLRIC